MSEALLLGPEGTATRTVQSALVAQRAAGYDWSLAPAESLRPGLAAVVVLPAWAGRRDPAPDLAAAGEVLRRLAEVRPARVVLVAASAIYSPRHDHPGLLREPAAQPVPRRPLAAAWAALEEQATELLGALPDVTLTILRAAPVLAPESPELLARQLLGRAAVVSLGYDPAVQVLAPEDLAQAVCRAVEAGKAGVFHLGSTPLPLRSALRLAGVFRLPLPHTWRRLARGLGRALGLAGGATELEGQRYPATVSAHKAQEELGFTPRWTSAEAILAARGRPVEAAGEHDPFGMDPAYIGRHRRTLFRFLRRVWWRIEVQGSEHIPRQGRVVLTGVHRGFMPYDGVMALDIVAAATGRIPRFLIHPCLVKPPFLADFMTKLGGILACCDNAGWVLEREGMLGFFPEGIRGAFTYYRDAYKLGKLGRDEFVKTALRHQAPIVPFVTVGSAEIFPVLAKIRWAAWERFTEWPCFPIAPPFPLLPVPLPSKWHTRFLPPIHVEERHGPEAADDPVVVAALSAEVRQVIEAAMADLLARRRHVFWGNIFETKAGPRPLAGERRKEATL